MKKMLRATKSMKYGTRRLLPGDEFEASSRDAHILLGLRGSKVEAVEKRPTSTRTVTYTPNIDRLERFSSQAPKAASVQPQVEAVTARDNDDTGVRPGWRSGDSMLDQLRSEAEGLGITIDGRWGPHRLRTEIDAKRKTAG